MPEGQKYRFNYSNKSDLEKCIEWAGGKTMPCRADKEVPCNLKVCELHTNRKIKKGETFYVRGNPNWIAHKTCVDNYLARHRSGVPAMNTPSKPALKREVPLEMTEQAIPATITIPDSINMNLFKDEQAPAASNTAAQSQVVSRYEIEMMLKMKYLEGYQDATRDFLRAKDKDR